VAELDVDDIDVADAQEAAESDDETGAESEESDDEEDGVQSVLAENVYEITPRSEWITSDQISHYEFAAVMAARATQIDRHNNPIFPEGYVPTDTNAASLALREYMFGLCPLRLRRIVGQKIEIRPVRELDWPPDDLQALARYYRR